MLARAVASHYGHPGLARSHSHAQQVGHAAHHLLTANGTEQAVDRPTVGSLDECRGQSRTARKAAAAAVGTGKHLLHLPQAGIFFDGKLLGYEKQHQRCNQRDGSKYQDCNQHKIHNTFFICFSYRPMISVVLSASVVHVGSRAAEWCQRGDFSSWNITCRLILSRSSQTTR